MQLLVEGAGKLGQTFPHNIKEKKGWQIARDVQTALSFTENEDFTPVWNL